MTSPLTTMILLYSDLPRPVPPKQIADALAVSLSTVYNVLRAARPKRKRSPRARTSEKRVAVTAMLADGYDVGTVALLAGCSRQYVYRIQGEMA